MHQKPNEYVVTKTIVAHQMDRRKKATKGAISERRSMISQQSREDRPAFDNQSMQSLQRSINLQHPAGLANTPEKKTDKAAQRLQWRNSLRGRRRT